MTTPWGHSPLHSSACGAGNGISSRVSRHELVDTCDHELTSPNRQRASEDTSHETINWEACQYTRCLRITCLTSLQLHAPQSDSRICHQHRLRGSGIQITDEVDRTRRHGLPRHLCLRRLEFGAPVTGTFQEVSSCTRWPDPARTPPNSPDVWDESQHHQGKRMVVDRLQLGMAHRSLPLAGEGLC
jgi:hypothetical protein